MVVYEGNLFLFITSGILAIFNAIFTATISAATPLWLNFEQLVLEMYDYQDRERLLLYFNSRKLLKLQLFQLLSELLCVKWTPRLLSSLQQKPEILGYLRLDEADLIDLDVVVKHIPLVSLSLGDSTFLRTRLYA